MSKLFNMVTSFMVITTLTVSSILSFVSVDATLITSNITNSTQSTTSQSSISQSSSTDPGVSSVSSVSKNGRKNKKKVNIVNNEIVEEDGIILNKKDQERYDKCKKEVASKRVKRFKNKPTPCLKMTNTEGIKDSHITPEDYNILWATVAENKDLMDTKVDPNIELPLSTYLNLEEIEIVNNSSS